MVMRQRAQIVTRQAKLRSARSVTLVTTKMQEMIACLTNAFAPMVMRQRAQIVTRQAKLRSAQSVTLVTTKMQEMIV